MQKKNLEYLNTRQAADYLGMSRQWLEIGRHRGYGPPYCKVGRAVRYRRLTLDQWMAGHERRHTADGAKEGRT